MIQLPEQMTFSNKKFSMILYGSPGVGKTTLALSAPDPVLIDFDRGVSRVSARHRTPTMVCGTYEEVLHDIEDPLVKGFQTIIIDTGGSFVTYLQDWAMRSNPAANQQKNGALSLKGFGAVKSEFNRFTGRIRDVMDKNLIYVFHSVEEKDKDGLPIQRLLCEGSARNNVWQPCDFGAYLQMIGSKRYLSFSPDQEFFAKGCFGIEGRREVPALNADTKNDYLTRLFGEARDNIAEEDRIYSGAREKYASAVEYGRTIIDNIVDVDTANSAMPVIKAIEHALTSKAEVNAMFNAKTKELGLVYDYAMREYVERADEAKGA